MFEITDFETGRRVRGTLLLSGSLVAFVVLTIALFPSIQQSGVNLDAYIQNLPEEARRAFIGDVESITTIDGYLASQFYQIAWLLGLGIYYAYAGASSVAKEMENGTLDLVLAHPVTRTRLVVGKYLALVPSMLAVNAFTFLAVYASVGFIGEFIDLGNLFVLHAYSMVYFLACASLGMVASVRFDTARRARTVGVGAIFGMFLVDTVTFGTDYDWIGDFAFTRYFDVGKILTDGTLSSHDFAVLVVAAVALLVVAAELFERRDV
ncbi:ABC transporter permease [Haladaptatus sp. CMAA 1911]|uniref:ABC transporter permease n=1 Tax=unclassified Haladaptatus TaxID=2622732 RepID=UPI003754C973